MDNLEYILFILQAIGFFWCAFVIEKAKTLRQTSIIAILTLLPSLLWFNLKLLGEI